MRSSTLGGSAIVSDRHSLFGRVARRGLLIGCVVLCSGCMNDYGDLDFVDDLPDAARGPAKGTAAALLPQQPAPNANGSASSTVAGELPSTSPEQSAPASSEPALSDSAMSQ